MNTLQLPLTPDLAPPLSRPHCECSLCLLRGLIKDRMTLLVLIDKIERSQDPDLGATIKADLQQQYDHLTTAYDYWFAIVKPTENDLSFINEAAKEVEETWGPWQSKSL